MGGSSSDYGYGIATDVMGNVFTTGTFRGTADFDPGPGTYNLTSNDNNVEYFDIFIQKSDANGNFEWAKQIGGSDDAHGNSITTDAMGNVYTTGWFKETIDFDPGPDTYDLISNGDEDIFIQKIDADGNFMWAKQMGAGSADLGYSITTDADGNVYTTGQFYGTVDLDPGSGTYNLISNGASDIFIQKLDADGNFIWAKQMGAHSVDVGYSIATDAGGNVYTTGQFSSGFADFDPGPDTYNLPNGGFFSMFVQKLDTNGDFVWAKRMSDDLASNIAQYHIAADAVGNVYTTGNFQGTADFYTDSGTYSLTSNGSHDIFIQKLDTDGNFIWAKQMGRGGGDYGRSMVFLEERSILIRDPALMN